MKKLLIILITFASFKNIFAQDSARTATAENYFLELKIPKEWEITRMKQGSDYTLSAQSPDKELYLFYCQFMEGDSQPKQYLETYTAQLGMTGTVVKEVKKNIINGKPAQFYYAQGEGAFLDERFKVFLLTTSINEKNIIAYIIYPILSNSSTQELIEQIMLYSKLKK